MVETSYYGTTSPDACDCKSVKKSLLVKGVKSFFYLKFPCFVFRLICFRFFFFLSIRHLIILFDSFFSSFFFFGKTKSQSDFILLLYYLNLL